MRRTGLLILYVVATAIALGGVGDLTIRALFDVHKSFLGTADVPAATTSLILHLLHALGGGLVGIGIASFAYRYQEVDSLHAEDVLLTSSVLSTPSIANPSRLAAVSH